LSELGKKFPGLAKADSTQALNVLVSASEDSSNWLLLPNNMVLLTSHLVLDPHGETAPFYPTNDPDVTRFGHSHILYLFDNSGKILNKGKF